MQKIFRNLSALAALKGKKPLLVCDRAFDLLGISLPFEAVRFSGFTSNPLYRDAEAGARAFGAAKCNALVAIGGGSSIDTAKCIKHILRADIPFLALPTTAGTGSEATRFAVVYRNGEKLSVADPALLPDCVILAPETLRTLPLYQKKCTLLDALCQAIESWWAKNATPESIGYARQAIGLILGNLDGHLKNEEKGNENMLEAAHLAGRAINITTTTAPHAMSYKLTTLYQLPHGHSVALCLPKVWRHTGRFDEIARALGRQNAEEAAAFLEGLLNTLGIAPPKTASASDLALLADTVDPQRLENHPVGLDRDELILLYKEILEV